MTFILIGLTVSSINPVKVTKADRVMETYFFRVILSLVDFIVVLCFNPLSFSGLLVFTNVSFALGFIVSYYDELTDSSDKPELSDTGSSSGPRKLKDNALVHFI